MITDRPSPKQSAVSKHATRPLPAFALSALMVLLAACGGDGPSEPTVTVASVTVSPATATLGAPGETVQFSATVRGSDGSTMNTAVTWSTSDASVATVSNSGLATAVAAGSAAITATAGGKAGSAVVTVEEASQACQDATTVSLDPGGSALFDAGSCFVLPSGTSGDRYRVAVYRPTAVEDDSDVTTVTLTVTGLGVSQSPPAPAPSAAAAARAPRQLIPGLDASLERALRVAEATARDHAALRAADERIWAQVGPSVLPSRRASAAARAPGRASSPAKAQFDPRTPSSCSAGAKSSVTAILIDENDDLAIYQDSTQHASTPVTATQASGMLSYYSSYGKQVIADYFGVPSDIDGNGKVVIFVTPSVDGEVAARVWSGDFFPQSQCAPSNEMEIVYFNNELVQAMDDASNPSYQALETVVHELKHVVSLYHRIAASNRLGSSEYHPSWIEEGTAEIAGNMSSRVAWADNGGPAVNAALTRDDFVASGLTPENYGVLLRMARTIWYLGSQPNGLVVTPQGAGDGHSVYGTGWHFHRWLGDGYGDAAASAFADAATFKAQNDSTARGGLTGLQNLTGKSYADLLEEYFGAIMLHGVGPDPQHAFTSYAFQSATDVLASQPAGVYPWPVTERSSVSGNTQPAGFNSASYTGPIGPSGVRIHDFLSNGTGTGAQIEVTASPPAKVLVVRVK